MHAKISHITFTSATDGNHGRGLAWAAQQLVAHKATYVHKDTSQARIDAIAKSGPRCVGWCKAITMPLCGSVAKMPPPMAGKSFQTPVDGYEEVPAWVMHKAIRPCIKKRKSNFSAQGITKPTHVVLCRLGWVLAAATIGFYHQLFGADQPICVVVEPSEAACLYESAKAADGEPHTVHG